MSRLIRNTVILVKTEVTYGLDPVPVGGTDAMLVSNLNINPLNANNVPRDLIRGFMGGAEQLVGNRFVECGFDVELAGSGTAGTAPAYAPLLKACGFAETLTASIRADYTPISTAFNSATIYWYDDGLLHKLTGARGDVSFKMSAGGRPMMSYKFKGLYSTPTAAANAAPTLTAFKTPQVINEANTNDLTFGGTHATAIAPAITGGTPYPSLGMDVMVNNKVDYDPLLGGESVEITDRQASCSFQLDLTAAQENTFMAAVEAATLTTVGLIHGTTGGNKVLMWLPFVQRINPQKQDQNGKRMVQFEGRVTPSAGNDELRLVLF
ncbi:phage tail tube protein [Caenimonas terrae]|uniref:Phage tail tube protein n=1 Tax=Caenimonas terrae TaxID=696074 RepID=A0ABW0NC74_9BURK